MDGLDGVILDVDGTLLRGDEPIPGAPAAVEAVREAGLELLCVSNNPVDPPDAYADRLGRAGIDVRPEEVLTSGVVTAEVLADEFPDARTYVVGEAGLVELLEDRGVEVVEDPTLAEVVVGSVDRSFDYDALTGALRALRRDPPPMFVGTDPDRTIPAEDGPVPWSGAVLDAMASVAGRPPDRVLGKPGESTRRLAFDRLGVPPDATLVVGDSPGTDLALGARAGARTALVRSGSSDDPTLEDDRTVDHALEDDRTVDPALEDDLTVDPAPEYVLDSVADLPDHLGDL